MAEDADSQSSEMSGQTTIIQGNVETDGDFVAGDKTTGGSDAVAIGEGSIPTSIKNFFLGERDET